MRGILLIHGYAGGRFEVEPLTKRLTERGYHVVTPKLAGHEGTPHELGRARYREWIASGIEAYEELMKTCTDIDVIGFSMGGLIAVQIYQKHAFKRLITVNTPIYYWDVRPMLRNLFHDFFGSFKRYVVESFNKPMSSLREFLRILKKTKPLFATLTCEYLIIQSQDDDVVNRKSANFIQNAIKIPTRLVKIPVGGHWVLLSEHAEPVIQTIVDFLQDT